MKRPYLIFLLVSVVVCGGCTGPTLNPGKAKEQIEAYFNAHPQELTGNVSFEAIIKGKDTGSNSILFRLFTKGGLIKLKEARSVKGADSVYYFEITRKGKPYVLNETVSVDGYPFFVVKTFDYYVSPVSSIRYSPDRKEAAALFDLAIRNLTPFGELAADPNHKMALIAFFQHRDNEWIFQRIEINIDELDLPALPAG